MFIQNKFIIFRYLTVSRISVCCLQS